MMTTSIWEFEYLCIHTLVPSFHNRARLPLLPSLGTMISCVWSSLVWSLDTSGILAFVSIRKIKRGASILTNLVRAWTDRGIPSPWQFQDIIVIKLGGAVLQSSPYRHPYWNVFPHSALPPFFLSYVSLRWSLDPILVAELGQLFFFNLSVDWSFCWAFFFQLPL